jgi:hypothetical protein
MLLEGYCAIDVTMSTNTAQKLQHELQSLQGLAIINLMCSALAFAFGAYFLMPNLVEAATTLTIPPIEQIGLMVLGGIAFGVAFKWLLSTIPIMEVAFDLGNSLKKQEKDKTLDDTALTGLIVGLTAAYRENKPTLKLMVTISKIAGVLFALAATVSLITIAIGASDTALWMGLLNAAISYAVAAACYIIPHFFKNYSTVWDQRLAQTAKAEAELQKALGEA